MTSKISEIDFHADDFALSKNSDNDILELCRGGFLNSISIIPNLAIFDSSIEKFNNQKKDFPQSIKISIHLNFMEGKCIAPLKDVPHLVDENGFFTISWGKLFLWNYNPFLRKKIINELETEITAQTKKCIESKIITTEEIRFDSHQHPHMIPIVFESLTKSIEKNNFNVSYIRNSRDLVLPYLSIFNFWKTYNIVNLIKCLILNLYSHKIVRYLKKHRLPIQILSGVFLSGQMDFRLKKLIPKLYNKASKKNRSLEILFHPGTMLESELNEEFTKKGFNDFHLSKERKIEFETCKKIIQEFDIEVQKK